MTILRTTAQITEILDQLARRIKGAYAEPPRLIGLHTGGAWIAHQLASRMFWAEAALPHKSDHSHVVL